MKEKNPYTISNPPNSKTQKLNAAWSALTILKYAYSVLITFLAFQTIHSVRYLLMNLTELALIIGIHSVVLSRSKAAGAFLQFIALLLYNVEALVMYFSGSFVRLVMLSNLVFLNGLQGNFSSYLRLAIPLAIFTLVPPKSFSIRKKYAYSLAAALAGAEAISLWICGIAYSPLANVYALYAEHRDYKTMLREISDLSAQGGPAASGPSFLEDGSVYDDSEFFKAQIDDYVQKPPVLPENPNVIVIFIEGLSKNIISDERGIMPALNAFESESLSFDNYYNHTFPTLRGLIGQLYSGYQMDNFDTNSLVSMQYIFSSKGYQTAFINTEPNNAEFAEYLENLHFDKVITDVSLVDEKSSYIPDGSAYRLLLATAENQAAEGIPFFTAIYTYGTHMSLDSPDNPFGDGDNIVLNRFYNQDCQFAAFLDAFKESSLFEDTVLVVTTDHATYTDSDFISAFPGYERISPELDQIPFYIYHAGIQPEHVDAGGRNSLDFAPTVLDYLDITSWNYFLGDSLFAPPKEELSPDTIFNEASSSAILNSSHGQIRQLTEDELAWFRALLVNYYIKKGDAAQSSLSDAYIYIDVAEDFSTMDITLQASQEYSAVWFPVWSDANGQDDLIWYEASRQEDGWHCTISLSGLQDKGIYHVHAYADTQEPAGLVGVSWVNLYRLPDE